MPRTAPVDVNLVASALGIDVVERPGLTFAGGEEVSGLLLRRQGRTICVINGDHSQNRKRFSVAHEIGHYFLHPFEESYIDYDFRVQARDEKSSQGTHRQEIEANAFAAELLMPEDVLRSEIKLPLNVNEDEVEVRRLAKRFRVSQQAMTHRLTNLGLLRQW